MITTEELKSLLDWAEAHIGSGFDIVARDGDCVFYNLKNAAMLCDAHDRACLVLEISKREDQNDREEQG